MRFNTKAVLALTVLVASCTGNGRVPATPSVASTAGGSDGGVRSNAAGDVKSGTGAIDLDRLRMDRQSPAGVSLVRQYVLPGQAYRIEVGETIELWAEYSGAANPRLIVDWGVGEPDSPDFTGCGSCRLTHRYTRPGRYTVVVKLDDRVSTTVTRTFLLDSTTLSTAFAAPAVGTTGTTGVLAGNPWIVCRADVSTAFLSANSNGTYNGTTVCQSLGYTGFNANGGTCGTVCGYCGTPGLEAYDGSNGCTLPQMCSSVQWRCFR